MERLVYMALGRNKQKELAIDTPFDQYSRQMLVTQAIDAIRDGEGSFSILDVGGYKGKTAEFMPDDSVTIVDLFDVKEANYVQGSGLDLPFDDDSFDFALSFDVLEHVSKKDRHRFFDECARVAKRGVVICAPNASETNVLAEKHLNEYYQDIHGTSHQWLVEHIQNGIPDMVELGQYAQKNNMHTVMVPSNDTLLWTLLQGAFFLQEKYPDAPEELVALNTYVNEKLVHACGRDDTTSYRSILCAFRSATHAKAVAMAVQTAPLKAKEMAKVLHLLQSYYLGLASNAAANFKACQREAESLAAELDEKGKRLEAIQSSLPWRMARKVKHAKNRLIRVNRSRKKSA